MNIASLIHDAPPDKQRPQLREEQPLPQHERREPSRERPPSRQQQPPLPPHPHLHPSQSSYHASQSSRNPRPLSPPRTSSQDYVGSHPQTQVQRLPPPSAIMPERYEPKPRRQELPPLPPPLSHEPLRGHIPPSSMGPPGQPHPYSEHHRLPTSRSQPPTPTHSHPSHHHSHGSPHTSGASPMYMPPPGSRNSLSSKLGTSPPGPGIPPPTGNSIPLFPTPVGPGMGPPSHLEVHSRGPPSHFSEQSAMYNGPLSGQGSSRLPLPHPHHPHQHPHPHEHVSRHRRSGSGGHSAQAGSPAMSSLQRPYDDGPRGPHMMPPSQLGGGMGPGAGSSVGRGEHHRAASTMSAGRAPPQMLTGPGAAGMHGEPLSLKDHERLERDKEREREGRSMERREREMRAREREMYEMEREKAWEREQRREEERIRSRERREPQDFMSGMLGGERIPDVERERLRRAPQGNMTRMQDPPVWSRFANRADADAREREMAREAEWQREREMAAMREHEERRAREMDMEVERERAERMSRQVQQGRVAGRERQERDRDRVREVDRDVRKERPKESSRRVSNDGWLPEPRAPEGWSKDAERERERERMHLQREREREIAQREEMEALRPRHPPGHHHHLVHNHHRHSGSTPGHPGSVSGHTSHSKSSKMGKQPELNEIIAIGPPVSIGNTGLPPPFNSIDRPLIHKTSSKTPIGAGPGHLPPSQIHPQHFHPSVHLQMHQSPLPQGPLGFQTPRASTPPPFTNALTAPSPAIVLQSRSPRPPIPTLKPRHLGTFVYPSLPFPFLDFGPPPADPLPNVPAPPLVEKEIREIRATLLIPSGFLPTQRPKHPRIWGGAPIPNFHPLFAAPQLIHHIQSGMSTYGYARPHPYEVNGVRRVYTDDSDMFLCALHAGWISWSLTRQAKKEGKDLRLEVRLSREARYVGGLGAKYTGDPDGQDRLGDDDGRSLLSAGWGNGHDGAGVEILQAEFVKKNTAHKLSLPNRSQRILEYSERSSALGCMNATRKRRRVDAIFDDDVEDFALPRSADADLCASRTITFGHRQGLNKPGFKYNPDVVQNILFPSEANDRPHKKPRLSNSNALQMDIDDDAALAPVPSEAKKASSIIVETLAETLLFSPQPLTGAANKENAVTNGVDHSAAPTYTIALVKISKEASTPRIEDAPAPPSDGDVKQAHEDKQATPSAVPPAEIVKVPPPEDAEKTALEGPPQPVADAKESTASAGDTLATDSDIAKPEAQTVAAPASATYTAPEPATKEMAATDKPMEGEAKASDAVAAAPPAETTRGSTEETTLASPQPAVAVLDIAPPGSSEDVKMVDEAASTKVDHPPASVPVSKPAVSAPPKPQVEKFITTLEVLQRNVGQGDLLFDAEGISVLSSQVENGMRKGWKIEARSWRWATEDLAVSA